MTIDEQAKRVIVMNRDIVAGNWKQFGARLREACLIGNDDAEHSIKLENQQ